MKKRITYLCIVSLCATSLSAMYRPAKITSLSLKLFNIATTIAYGKIIGIPQEDNFECTVQCNLHSFLFTFKKNSNLKCPCLDVLIKTDDEHHTRIAHMNDCPLLPCATAILPFRYKDQSYNAYVMPTSETAQ